MSRQDLCFLFLIIANSIYLGVSAANLHLVLFLLWWGPGGGTRGWLGRGCMGVHGDPWTEL